MSAVLSPAFASVDPAGHADACAHDTTRPSFDASDVAGLIKRLRSCDNSDVVNLLMAMVARIRNDAKWNDESALIAILDAAADAVDALDAPVEADPDTRSWHQRAADARYERGE